MLVGKRGFDWDSSDTLNGKCFSFPINNAQGFSWTFCTWEHLRYASKWWIGRSAESFKARVWKRPLRCLRCRCSKLFFALFKFQYSFLKLTVISFHFLPQFSCNLLRPNPLSNILRNIPLSATLCLISLHLWIIYRYLLHLFRSLEVIQKFICFQGSRFLKLNGLIRVADYFIVPCFPLWGCSFIPLNHLI